MAAIDFAGIVSMIGIILKVAVGLGAVIFVHERRCAHSSNAVSVGTNRVSVSS